MSKGGLGEFVAFATVALTGLGAIGTNIAWLAVAQKFFNSQAANFGVKQEDYVGSDQPRALIALSMMSSILLGILSASRLYEKFDSILTGKLFAVMYNVLIGIAVVSSTVAYSYSLNTLSKFEPIYDQSYKSLKLNALPSAATWSTIVFVCSTVAFTVPTLPAVTYPPTTKQPSKSLVDDA